MSTITALITVGRTLPTGIHTPYCDSINVTPIHEAACILQEKAAHHTMMMEHYRVDLERWRADGYSEPMAHYQYSAGYCLQHQRDAARASAAARTLMGVE